MIGNKAVVLEAVSLRFAITQELPGVFRSFRLIGASPRNTFDLAVVACFQTLGRRGFRDGPGTD